MKILIFCVFILMLGSLAFWQFYSLGEDYVELDEIPVDYRGHWQAVSTREMPQVPHVSAGKKLEILKDRIIADFLDEDGAVSSRSVWSLERAIIWKRQVSGIDLHCFESTGDGQRLLNFRMELLGDGMIDFNGTFYFSNPSAKILTSQ